MADSSLVVAGAVVSAAAGVFGWVAWRAQRAHERWCASRTQVEGVVARLVSRHRYGGLSEDANGMPNDATTTVPVVRFRAQNGVEYEIDATDAPRDIGAVVVVAYDPALPSDGRTVARTPKIGCAVPLLVAGAVLMVLGALRG